MEARHGRRAGRPRRRRAVAHFPAGVGKSKMVRPQIDKAIASPPPRRNYRTVVKLREMLEA